MLLAVRQCHGIDERYLVSSMVNPEEGRLRRCNDEATKGREERSRSKVQKAQTLFEKEMGWTGSRPGDLTRDELPCRCAAEL